MCPLLKTRATLAVFHTGMRPCMQVDAPLAVQASPLTLPVRLAIAAVPKLSIFSNLQFGGVGGGDAVPGLHAVALLQLRQSTHQASVGCIQGRDALLLHTHKYSWNNVHHKITGKVEVVQDLRATTFWYPHAKPLYFCVMFGLLVQVSAKPYLWTRKLGVEFLSCYQEGVNMT